MRYPYKVGETIHDGELIWLAESTVLKYCFGVGDTKEEALEELAENEAAWLETAQANGYPIPEVENVQEN